MNLNYEEFKEKIKDDIKDYMDEKYKDCGVVIRKVNKTNREVDGLNFYDIPGLILLHGQRHQGSCLSYLLQVLVSLNLCRSNTPDLKVGH